MTKTNIAQQIQTTPKTQKSIFSLSNKDLKAVHGGKGVFHEFDGGDGLVSVATQS